MNKSSEEFVWLEQVHTNSNVIEITDFINELPPGIRDHRNQLKNYINIKNLFREHNKRVMIGVDFQKSSRFP